MWKMISLWYVWHTIKTFILWSLNRHTTNMFSLMKKRNEAARQKKMDHIFQKADENGNGKITPQQMVKAFAANDVTGN